MVMQTGITIALLPLVLLVLVLVGLFVLAARTARKHGWGIVLAVPCLLILAAFFVVFGVRVSPRETITGQVIHGVSLPVEGIATEAPLPVEKFPIAEAPSPAFDQELNADVYPSLQSGAVALTRRLLDSLHKLIPDGVKLGTLTITGDAPPDILAAVAEAARAKLPGASVGIQGMPANPAGDGTAADLRIYVRRSIHSSQITARLLPGGGGNGLTEHARVTEKPWVEAPWQSLSTDGSQPASRWSEGPYRFAVHSELSSSQTEARRQALRRVVERLQPVIEGRLGRTLSGSEKAWLTRQLWMDVEAGRLRTDRFEQKITKPYGQVWRCSMLVDSPEGEIAGLTSGYLRQLNVRRAGWRHTLLMAAGLAVGIIVLYLFLNMATKGYYMWTLRVAGVVAVAAGVFFVLKLG
jgi:hypothetical protein